MPTEKEFLKAQKEFWDEETADLNRLGELLEKAGAVVEMPDPKEAVENAFRPFVEPQGQESQEGGDQDDQATFLASNHLKGSKFDHSGDQSSHGNRSGSKSKTPKKETGKNALVSAAHAWRKEGVLTPWDATKEEIQAGKVPGVVWKDFGKDSETNAHYSHKNQNFEVSDRFMNRGTRKILAMHEVGHLVSRKAFDDENNAKTIEMLEPFRKDKSKSLGGSSWTNIAGYSSRPEEIIADIYASRMLAPAGWEKGGKYDNLEEYVLKLAREIGLPDKQLTTNHLKGTKDDHKQDTHDPTKGSKEKDPKKKVAERQLTARQKRAIASHVPADKKMQRASNKAEGEIAKQIGARWVTGRKPMDNVIGEGIGVEIKVMHKAKTARVNMRPNSRIRKEIWMNEADNRSGHVVLIDDRPGDQNSGHRIYYKSGVGAYRLPVMTKVDSIDDLKFMIQKEHERQISPQNKKAFRSKTKGSHDDYRAMRKAKAEAKAQRKANKS